jgi:hypothetical protein
MPGCVRRRSRAIWPGDLLRRGLHNSGAGFAQICRGGNVGGPVVDRGGCDDVAGAPLCGGRFAASTPDEDGLTRSLERRRAGCFGRRFWNLGPRGSHSALGRQCSKKAINQVSRKENETKHCPHRVAAGVSRRDWGWGKNAPTDVGGEATTPRLSVTSPYPHRILTLDNIVIYGVHTGWGRCGAGVAMVRKCRADRPVRVCGAEWPGLASRLGLMRLGWVRRPMTTGRVFSASTYS